MSVLKCKPWGKGQGEFVLVDEFSFDPTFHKLFDPPAREAQSNESPHKTAGGKPKHATPED